MCIAKLIPNIQASVPNKNQIISNTINALILNLIISGKYFTATKIIAINPIKLNIYVSLLYYYNSTF